MRNAVARETRSPSRRIRSDATPSRRSRAVLSSRAPRRTSWYSIDSAWLRRTDGPTSGRRAPRVTSSCTRRSAVTASIAQRVDGSRPADPMRPVHTRGPTHAGYGEVCRAAITPLNVAPIMYIMSFPGKEASSSASRGAPVGSPSS
ncbi:Uncharacterised protein [Mycobacteroides abscessus]|nr:Uncharacterised protein [Mycobacteroides abscessus]